MVIYSLDNDTPYIAIIYAAIGAVAIALALGVAASVGAATGLASGIGFIGRSTQAAMGATTVTKVRTVVAAYNTTVGLGKDLYEGITKIAG